MKKGFSLIELSIVILILSVVAAASLNFISKKGNSENIINSRKKMEYIEKALKVYINANDKLPCPAGSEAFIDPVFGVSKGNGTECDQGVGMTDGSQIYSGFVPVVTLGLPPDYMFDEWGRRISYIMDGNLAETTNWTGSTDSNIKLLDGQTDSPALTRDPTSEEIGNTVVDCSDSTGATVWNDVQYSDKITVCPAFLLISHGQNGFLALDAQGTTWITSPSVSGVDEADNTIFDIADTAEGEVIFDSQFIIKPTVQNPSQTEEYFDDIFLYKSKEQMQETD